MEFQDDKLSIISILFITGLSCLAFAGIMKLLEGNIPSLFLKAGIITVALASLLSLLKFALGLMDAKKQSGKSGRSAGIGS
mgnify:CR=1 FL=1